MASTPSFNWSTPDNTGLVKNGALDIRTLGNAIDTSMTDLLGGTTGQVLKKNSNTDMDFVWSSDASGMTNPMTTTGDTIYSSSGSTPARLGIGSTGQVLTVAGGVPSWATPAGGGGKVLQVVSVAYSTNKTIATTTFTDTNLTLSITPTSATSKILVLVTQGFSHSRLTNETGTGWKIVRGATDIAAWPSQQASQTYAAGTSEIQIYGVITVSYLDSPATTSATTYKTMAKVGSTANSGTSDYNYGGTNMILMEIGA